MPTSLPTLANLIFGTPILLPPGFEPLDCYQQHTAPTPEILARAEAFFTHFDPWLITPEAAGHPPHTTAYAILADHIIFPPKTFFPCAENYYARFAHEVIHWTLHPSRLNRGPECQAPETAELEETTAELGATLLLNHLGLEDRPHPHHIAYIQATTASRTVVEKAYVQALEALAFLDTFTSGRVTQFA